MIKLANSRFHTLLFETYSLAALYFQSRASSQCKCFAEHGKAAF
jgi:hypothetical protein